MTVANNATCGIAWRESNSASAMKPAMATAATAITTATVIGIDRTVTTDTTTIHIAVKLT